jgi:hypothetical protein
MANVQRAYELVADRTPSLAIGVLAGNSETKRRLVIETIRLAIMFNEDDWRLISTWLDSGAQTS